MYINYFEHKLGQAGDTIVEVLIAILVVSLVLAGAYASTTHNVAATQDTQEHSQALQLVQSQVEFLRASVAGGATNVPTCYKSDGSAATVPASDCAVDRADVSGCTAEPCYGLSISGGPTVYTVAAQWASLLNSQTNNVSVYYEP